MVPAAYIVVDHHSRVPLRHLVERAVVAHPSPALRRDVEVPRRYDVERRAGSERSRQIDTHRRAEPRALRFDATDAQRFQMAPAIESLTGEVERSAEEDERRLIELVGDAGRRA